MAPPPLYLPTPGWDACGRGSFLPAELPQPIKLGGPVTPGPYGCWLVAPISRHHALTDVIQLTFSLSKSQLVSVVQMESALTG